MIRIEIDDREVMDALQRLQRRVGDLTPAMEDIGELLIETTKQRFATSTAPDGRRWAPNSPATILSYLQGKSGAFGKRDGRLTKKGAKLAANKKPLIGETKSLSTQINYRADRASVEIGSLMPYAAIHQFGGQAGRGKKVTIPARPFLGLSESDKRAVLEIIEEHLAGR